ncbi:Nudix hydrolase 14, chloroplastic, partial [Sesamum angolense]
NAIESSLFKQWLKNIQTETGLLANGAMSLRQVLIQSVDMFGSRVGFLKFKADVIDKETGQKNMNRFQALFFARGPAVAVLILLDSDGETYAVLTEQVRVPVGKLILELPAGMLDDDKGDIVGTAVREKNVKVVEFRFHLFDQFSFHRLRRRLACLNLDDVVDLTAFYIPQLDAEFFLLRADAMNILVCFCTEEKSIERSLDYYRAKKQGLETTEN